MQLQSRVSVYNALLLKSVYLFWYAGMSSEGTGQNGISLEALKFCFKTCVAMKFVDDDDDDDDQGYWVKGKVT